MYHVRVRTFRKACAQSLSLLISPLFFSNAPALSFLGYNRGEKEAI